MLGEEIEVFRSLVVGRNSVYSDAVSLGFTLRVLSPRLSSVTGRTEGDTSEDLIVGELTSSCCSCSTLSAASPCSCCWCWAATVVLSSSMLPVECRKSENSSIRVVAVVECCGCWEEAAASTDSLGTGPGTLSKDELRCVDGAGILVDGDCWRLSFSFAIPRYHHNIHVKQ